MKTIALSTLAAVTMALSLVAVAGAARADGGGGGRTPAGGAHMSSYVHHPYHDPRSVHSQARGTGQLLGAPIVADRAATPLDRRDSGMRNWAAQPCWR